MVQRNPNALAPADLLPFLNDLATGFPEGGMADVITPTLSLFFQEWFKITPTPDLLGQDWQKYLGAMTLLVQVKAIAAIVSREVRIVANSSYHPSLSGSPRMLTLPRSSGSHCWDRSPG